MATVHYRGKRSSLTNIVRQLGAILSGKRGDPDGIAQGFASTIGFAALSDIKDAYITKARGGTDEMGIKWLPLKPATIAARRVGPGDTGNSDLIRNRERIRKRETSRALRRFRLSLPEQEAQRRAAIVGGQQATKQTGQTKEATLGGRSVEILRDTSVLINSLSPGQLTRSSYTKPQSEGGEEQIFEVQPGEVVVGTNVLYASTHQHGRGAIPARPFLPTDKYPVPNVWWDRWLDVANKALVVSLARLIRRTT
jgi:hypothetical protein